MKPARRATWIFCAGSLVAISLANDGLGSGELRVVVLNDTAIPGVEPHLAFDRLLTPVLNDNGQVAFGAIFDGPGIDSTNSEGILSETEEYKLRLVVRSGSQAPGTSPEEKFKSFTALVLNNNGQTAFMSELNRPESISPPHPVTLYSEGSGSGLRLVSHTGVPVTGLETNPVYLGLNSLIGPALNDQGRITFHARVSADRSFSSSERAVISQISGGQFEQVVRKGDSVSTTKTGELNLNGISLPSPYIHESGNAVFHGRFQKDGVVGSRHFGITSGRLSEGLKLHALAEQIVPQAGPNAVFESLEDYAPVINRHGHVAFTGVISEGNKTYEAIFSEGGGSGLELLARSGRPPATSGQEIFFDRLSGRVMINDDGQIAFSGYVRGSNRTNSEESVIYKQCEYSNLEVVAYDGMPTPGAALDSSTLHNVSLAAINDRGQVVISALIAETGESQPNNRAIFAQDQWGDLQLIASEGQMLDVSDDLMHPDLREVTELQFLGNQQPIGGSQSAFNAAGQLAFHADFTDGSSGIFVSNKVAIPEPNTGLLLVFLVVLHLGRCRKRF